MNKTTKRVKTAEIKFYCEPELKAQIEEARGLVSISAWMRDAAHIKLGVTTNDDYDLFKWPLGSKAASRE